MRVKSVLLSLSCLGATPALAQLPPAAPPSAGGQPVPYSTMMPPGMAAPGIGAPGIGDPDPYGGTVNQTVFDPNVALPAMQNPLLAYGSGGVGDESLIPEAWLHSAFDPVPAFEARVELLFLRPNFDDSGVVARRFGVDQVGIISRPGQRDFVDPDVRLDSKSQYITSFGFQLEKRHNEFWSFEVGGVYVGGPSDEDFDPTPDDSVLIQVGPNGADVDDFVRLPGDRLLVGSAVGGPLTNLPAFFPQTATALRVDWDLEAGGFDVNAWRHCVPIKGRFADISFGAGFRYFGIYESVAAEFVNDDPGGGGSGTLRTDTDNSLYGGQLGFRSTLQVTKKFRLRGENFVAFMANYNDNEVAVEANGGVVAENQFDSWDFAPLIETSLFGDFYVTPNLTFYAGFELIYVDRVSRAGDQVVPDLSAFLQNREDLGSSLIYGPRLGMQFNF